MLQPKMNIGIANENDLKKIHAWFSNGSTELPTFQDPNVTNIVAKNKNRIIASVQLVRLPITSHFYAGYWLFSLKVKPVYRGMGIGRRLNLMVIEMAINEGAKELFLQVNQNNLKAIKLYQHLGFNRKHIPALEALLEKEILPHGQRRIIMSKSFQEFS